MDRDELDFQDPSPILSEINYHNASQNERQQIIQKQIQEIEDEVQKQLAVNEPFKKNEQVLLEHEKENNPFCSNSKNESLLTDSKNLPKSEILMLPNKIEIGIQVGGVKKLNAFKYTQQIYAPQSFHIDGLPPLKQKQQNLEEFKKLDRACICVEVQVGVSCIQEPKKVITQAKTERILIEYDPLIKFVQSYKVLAQNQIHLLMNITDQVEKRKIHVINWSKFVKNHFQEYAQISIDFSNQSQKTPKQQKTEQLNKYLNIGQQLKIGYTELAKFRFESAINHKNLSQYIISKTIKDIDKEEKKYLQGMKVGLGSVAYRKKDCFRLEEQNKKQWSKVKKLFLKVKEDRNQEQQDFFIEISKGLKLVKQLKDALILWGKETSNLHKNLISVTQIYVNGIQQVLNNFKTQSNVLYGSQKGKFDKIYRSQNQIQQDCSISKLMTLQNSDYIRFALESTQKKQVNEISNQIFNQFIKMPHYSSFLGQPQSLLKNMIIKVFDLKNSELELVYTVSGNLVVYNKQTFQWKQKIVLKQIKDAHAGKSGLIEVEQKIPGVIFDSKRKVKLQFKNSDRAEQLICFLGQGETNNS